MAAPGKQFIYNLDAERFAHLINIIKFLPSEKFHGFILIAEISIVEMFGYSLGFATEMSVSRRLFIDRIAQFQAFLYGIRAKIENTSYFLCNFSVGNIQM